MPPWRWSRSCRRWCRRSGSPGAGRAGPGRADRAPAGAPRRLGAEPLRVEPGPFVPAAEELRPGQQGHHRLGEQEDHDDVDDRGQAEGVGEALDVAGGEVVQQHRRQERDRVGDQDRAPRPFPPGFDRRAERLAVPHLVTEPLEVDDERVGGDADRHHQAGDRRQRHGEVLVLAQQHDREVGQQRRDHQAGDRHDAESPVVVEQVDHDQDQAEDAREQPRAERGVAGLRGDVELALQLEGQRQRPELEDVLELGRLGLGEAVRRRAGDLERAGGERPVGLRRRRACRRRA